MTVLNGVPENPDDIAATSPEPSFGEKFSAGWTAETIRTDAWGYSERVEAGLIKEIMSRLPDDEARDLWDNQFYRNVNNVEGNRQLMFERAQAAAAADPEAWIGVPTDANLFRGEVDRRRRDELDEAEAVLDLDGGGFAGFLGQGARAMTDQTSLMMVPIGLQGSLARIAISEAVLGGIGEAVILPREYRVAEELDIDKPNPIMRIGMGMAFGGTLGLGIASLGRIVSYGRARRKAMREARPEETNRPDFEADVNARYEELSTGAETPAPETSPRPPRMADFDFSPEGNASPATNRIGYVFGRLISRGMEPHIAAGFVGNFMVESGPGLNTRAVGDSGAAFGIAQWNDRRAALIAFAQKQGKDPGDLDLQVDFLFHELETSESAAWGAIRTARTAREAAQLVSSKFERPGIPHMSRRVFYAETIAEQFQGGQIPKWDGARSPSYSGETDFTGYTSRGFTRTGQMMVGDEMRIDVDYEVVDLDDLIHASGDLQPRDRSRVSSDAWVADTAARLDPALLMPSPTADRGAPLIGPDNVIESGNGRVQAIRVAYDRFDDRAGAYRKQIEVQTGAPIPEGVKRPVLIARRTSDVDDASRRQLVVDAQDSGVARMNATERAQVGSRALSSELMEKYQPGHKFRSAENRDFARGFLGHYPRSERNAFVDAEGGLSIDGVQALKDAMFARAFDAPDILARHVETEAGELRSLMDALVDAAPHVALLRSEIDAGLIRPEMDITAHILSAARMIMQARDIAAREGTSAAKLVTEMLEAVDVLDGPVAPLTRALVQKMMPKGRQAPAEKIAAFLRRYVDEARKAGRAGGMLDDAVGPLDVLKSIDKAAFGDLTETGKARVYEQPQPKIDTEAMPENAFADGAQSPEAVAGDEVIEAGLVVTAFDDVQEARARRVQTSNEQPTSASSTIPDATGQSKHSLSRLDDQGSDPEAFRDALDEWAGADVEIEMPDGSRLSARELLDDLDSDDTLQAVLDACPLGRAG